MSRAWWKSARTTRVVRDMTKGSCINEFQTATDQCDPDWKQRKAMAYRKPGEVYSCAKATKALRKCMEGKAVLAKHLVAMDEGIKEDEWRRWDPYVRAKLDARYRWWTGMKKSDEEYY